MFLRTKPQRRGWLVAFCGAFAGCVLTACSPGATGDEAGDAGPATLRVSQGTDARTLDPLQSTFSFDQNVYGQVMETLFVFSPDATEVRPNLATKITAVDPTTWQVELRKDVVFHDGEIMDPESVKFSLDKLINSEAYAVFGPKVMESVSVKDEGIEIKTTSPAPSLPTLLARAAWIYPPDYTKKAGADFANHPVGTGPFEFVSWKRDDTLALKAFPKYWGGKSDIDRLVFRPIPDASARIAALEAGETDLIYDLPMDQVERVDAADGAGVISAPSLRPYEVYLDYRDSDSPLADRRVRQALNYAVDKKGIIDGLFLGYGKPLQGQPMPPEYFGANPDLQPYPHDPEKARSLLSEAGAEGLKLVLNCPQGRYVLDKSACETIASQLSQAGVKATVKIMEPSAFAETMAATKLGPSFYAGFLTPPDASYYYAIAGPGSPYRYFADNAEFDDLVTKGNSAIDEQKRLEYYHRAAEIVHEDPYAIYLWTVDSIYGLSDRVKDWTPNADETLNLRGVSIMN